MVNVINFGPEREKEQRQIQLLKKITEGFDFFKIREVFFEKGVQNDRSFCNIYIHANNGRSRVMVASVFPSTSTVNLYAQEAFNEFRSLVESYQKTLANSWTLVQDYNHPTFGTSL